jgi:hypothetical protein
MIAQTEASIPDASSHACHDTAWRRSSDVAVQSAGNGPRKILLPRRPGESRFAPRQYYYPASRSGVMPSGRFAA